MSDSSTQPSPDPLPGYLTADLPGTGGVLRRELDDFYVEEIPAYEPSGSGEHTLFAIEKRGLSTLQAVDRLADALDISPRLIGMAGLKDARAVTRQCLSVAGVPPERVLALELPDLRVLWAERHRNRLKLGHLWGNRFRIRVRNCVEGALQRAQAICAVLESQGVPNAFGPQRFGLRRTSHLLGRALLLSDAEAVLSHMLGSPLPDDPPEEAAARRLFEERGAADALTAWRGWAHPERGLLQRLARGSDPARAVASLPTPLRRLYVSAYQAALYNRLLAARLPHLGKLQPGDLAVKHDNGAFFLVQDASAEQPRADALQISPSGPLYGPKVRLAEGEPGRRERALLEEEGLYAKAWAVARSKLMRGVRLMGGRRPFRVPLYDLELAAEGRDLLLSFTLPAGAYATCVLREVTKVD